MPRKEASTSSGKSGRIRRARKRGFAGVAGVVAAALASYGIQGALPAQAAPTDDSEARGQVIISDLLGAVDLLALGGALDGYPSGDPATPVNGTLDVGALGLVSLDLGAIQMPLIGDGTNGGLLDLGSLGAAGSYANAPSSTTSTASAGTITADGALDVDPANLPPDPENYATLNLTDLLAQAGIDGLTDQIIDQLELRIGALASTATATTQPDGTVGYTSDYAIAGAQLELSSPLVGGLSGTIDTAVTGVQSLVDTTITGLQGPINTLVSGLPNINLGLLGVNLTGATVAATPPNLAAAVDSVLAAPIADAAGVVSVDLNTGVVTVNLENISYDGGATTGLNGLDPNTALLSAPALSAITAGVSEVLGAVTTRIVDAVEAAVYDTAVAITIPAALTVLGNTVNATITVDTTLGSLAGAPDYPAVTSDDISVDVTAGGLLPTLLSLLGVDLNGLVALVTDGIVANLLPGLITTAGTATQALLTGVGPALSSTLTGATGAILDQLSPVLGALNEVANIVINEQTTPTGTDYLVGSPEAFTVNALSIELLPNVLDLAAIDLASSTVRALATEPPVVVTPANGSATNDTTPEVTGTVPVYSAGLTVDVTITNPDGSTTVISDVPVADAGDGTGTWATVVPDGSALAEGVHTVSATSTDAAGIGSPTSNVNTFTIDVTAPAAPTVVTPADLSVTNDATPAVTGTVPAYEAGLTVDVTITGPGGSTTTIADVPVTDAGDGTGTWATVVPDGTPLAEGEYTVSATSTDLAGNTSGASNVNTFTVDLTNDEVPTVVTPADGDLIADSTPPVTGTVPTYEPGMTVDVTITNPDGSTTVIADVPVTDNGDGTGSWVGTSPALADGVHSVSATSTDAAGNVSDTSNVNSFTVDTTAAADAPVVVTPADGATVTDDTPEIAGTVPVYEPDLTVDVTITNPDGSTTVIPDVPVADAGDGTGTWTTTAPELAQGAHTVSAVSVDAAGNASPGSNINAFTVDSIAPAAPVVVSPADGSASNDTTPDLSGTVPAFETGLTVTVTLTNPDGSTTLFEDVPVVDAGDGSGTWTVAAGTLVPGDYTVEAVAVDAAGNVSDVSNINAFTVDTTAPEAPTVTGPADGSTISDSTPDITGTVPVFEPGLTVDVTIANPDGTTSVLEDVPVTDNGDGTGSWTVPAGTLTEGDYTVTATSTDAAGNVSPVSDAVTFTVDTTAPEAPTVTGPADGSTISDGTPDITGTVPVFEPGLTVDVTIANPDGTTSVLEDVPVTDNGDGTGSWTVPAGTLADGDYTVTATSTDVAGNVSPVSDEVTFTVDTTAPEAPAILTPTDGSITADTTPVISGTAEPETTVDVTVTNADGSTTVFEDVPVSAGGAWTITPATPLAQGAHTATAVAVDAAGNVSAPSEPVDFTIDSVAPVAPVITGPADGSVTNDATPVITGTAEPGTTVDVTITNPDGSTTVIEDVPVVDGAWSVTSPELADGAHTVTATSTDDAGNTSPVSAPVTFEVDTAEPAAPAITSPTDGQTIGDTTPLIQGTGEPGATVTVVIDGEEVGTALVDAGGAWQFPTTEPLADGDHTVSATQTDPAGNVSAPSDEVTFTVDSTIPAVDITSPAEGALTNDPTPEISGTGEPGSTITVIVDGVELGTTEVDEDGNWTFTPDEALADGEHEVEVVAEDGAGNTATDGPITFIVDTTAPDAPVITSPTDGDVLTDLTPEITGTAEPGSTVTVIIDGQPVGETTVNEDGDWTFTPTTPLTPGEHEITATATDPAGNVSDPSAPVGVTVPDYQPTITVPDAPAYPGTEIPVTGEGFPPNTEVEVVLTDADGDPVGEPVSVETDDEGGLSTVITVPEGVVAGEHTVVGSTEDGLTAEDTVTVYTPVVTPGGPVSPGEELPVTGGGFPPNTEVEVEVLDPDGNPVGGPVVVDTDGDGGFETEVPIPDDAEPGDYTVVVTTPDGSEFTAPAVVSGPEAWEISIKVVNPVLHRGDTQVTYGYGFAPGEVVTGTQTSAPLALGTQVADENGTVRFEWTIRSNEDLGEHGVTLTGNIRGTVTGTFQVVAEGGLAATGAVVWPALAAGSLALAAGALLLIRRRRAEADAVVDTQS
ncbi:Ig-like domain-containing protein [Microbacterium stercoris]|uniref:Choice-of-anchor G family protein n=1 Tax=Microbacterium stercoris TaxID=2820289 RepID=A0A939TM96_9MICO|nr:Ig-like domain-containing protein [Microbacterium stercoris]MBO3662968.1 choice-of-anchor G family protein [Microbacterium stercoris]